eukprot:scaffold295468_cov27-Tisochrysis_lutea.AAC.3
MFPLALEPPPPFRTGEGRASLAPAAKRRPGVSGALRGPILQSSVNLVRQGVSGRNNERSQGEGHEEPTAKSHSVESCHQNKTAPSCTEEASSSANLCGFRQ